MLFLTKPDVQYKTSYLKALEESLSDGKYIDIHNAATTKRFADYVKMLLDQAEGKSLPEGYVAQTTFWLIDHDEYIGTVNIRHTLNPHLLKEGGHIGYDIRPSKRRMGYGKKILALALPEAKKLGIDRALVTCDETNTGSKKIIEANGGVFENSEFIAEDKPRKLRYWITI